MNERAKTITLIAQLIYDLVDFTSIGEFDAGSGGVSQDFLYDILGNFFGAL